MYVSGPQFSGTTCSRNVRNDSALVRIRGLEIVLAGHVSRAGSVTFRGANRRPVPGLVGFGPWWSPFRLGEEVLGRRRLRPVLGPGSGRRTLPDQTLWSARRGGMTCGREWWRWWSLDRCWLEPVPRPLAPSFVTRHRPRLLKSEIKNS